MEVHVRGAGHDLHSGLYGGVAPNPFNALGHIIAGLKDENGRITIPGFYEAVTMPSDDVRTSWAQLPFDEKRYLEEEIGATELVGESGYTPLERTWARPTLEVHGMPGGFTAQGAKTVIPARASAKVSMRLVPNQDPEDILKKYSDFVKKITPKGVSVNIKVHSKGPAIVVGTDNKFVQASQEAMHEVFGKETVYIRSGGSIPIVADFANELKVPSVMMGFGLPDDNLHAPNEKFHIPNFYRGIESIIRFFQVIGA
jgi:acetylornithine deacetylase/succinyl-diaminopimelate desuccinylase-like protein